MKNRCLFWLFTSLFMIHSCLSQDSAPLPDISYGKIELKHTPLYIGSSNEDVIQIRAVVPDSGEHCKLLTVNILLEEGSHTDFLDSIELDYYSLLDDELTPLAVDPVATIKPGHISIEGALELGPGTYVFSVHFNVKGNSQLDHRFTVDGAELVIDGYRNLILEPEQAFTFRPAMVLRKAGEDHCDTYRIPGLVTTNRGTLVAVYDNRYQRSKDLQENIDVGMSRSTNGGQSWEPMRVIMDMGEWGGLPEKLNGIGDPSILFDHTSGTLWVAALWMSGLSTDDMLWWASKPGMDPDETGQFMLVKSTDDGLTWSEPINITEQIKDPAWQILLQGPGRGITTEDGILVFPAQFKADIGEKAIDGGHFTSHSTIVYSRDGGDTWNIGKGAISNTTEAQVVELADGSLMLNMRDDRNRQVKDETNGRAVAVTNNLGENWSAHPSSNSALPEPNCMASLISGETVPGEKGQLLFFSNPNHKETRTNMTIKASLDGGNTWPDSLQVLLNGDTGYGYSCMSMVNRQTIGILYEGVKELIFQKIPVSDLLSSYNEHE